MQRKHARTWWQLILVVLAMIFAWQVFHFELLTPFSTKRLLFTDGNILLNNLAVDGLLIIAGLIASKERLDFKLVPKFELLAVASLLIFNLALLCLVPSFFKYWNVFGIFFPILTSTAPVLAGLIFAIFCQPLLFDWLSKTNWQQAAAWLAAISIGFYILTVGMEPGATYSIWGIYLVLPFAWGMTLAHLPAPKKPGRTILAAIVVLIAALLLSVFLGKFPTTPGFVWVNTERTWNARMFIGQSSPLLLAALVGLAWVLRPILQTGKLTDLMLVIPALMAAQAPYTTAFWARLFAWNKNYLPSKSVVAIVYLAVLLGGWLLWLVMVKGLFRWSKLQGLSSLFATSSLSELGKRLLTKFKPHRLGFKRICGLVLYFMALTSVSVYIVSDHGYNGTTPEIVMLFGKSFGIVLLNVLIMLALFGVLYFLTTRFWVATGLITVIVLVLAVADKIKMALRNEPVFAVELREITNWRTLLPMVGSKTLIIAGLCLLILIALIVFLEIKHPIKLNGLKWRSILGICSVLVLWGSTHIDQPNSLPHYISCGFDNWTSNIRPDLGLRYQGPLIDFTASIYQEIMNKPTDYSQASVDQVMHKYQQVAKRINKHRKNNIGKQTVIFNLSESFADPESFPTLKLKKDPMPYIRSLSKRTTSGYMLSAGYGGGTANMEYESLTGFNMGNLVDLPTPYVQVTSRYTTYPNIGWSFNYASTVHPYVGTYYSRIQNYHRFGFKKFVCLGSKYKIIDQKRWGKSHYLSDYTAYQNGLRQINSQKGGQFINLITMQNHMPYPANIYSHNEYAKTGMITGQYLSDPGAATGMATYTKGVEYTDQAVKRFVNQIDRINKPIYWVFYGDHYPAILSQSHIATYPIKMHSTNYFIYANKYARAHGAKKKINGDKYVATSSFIPMMLEKANAKVTPYQALLTKIYQELPAMTINYKKSNGLELVDQSGKAVPKKKLTAKQQKLLHEYQLIQYDMSKGKGYSLSQRSFYR